MITFFRNFFQSKVGIVVTLAFLGLIAIAFASSDVANNATFGGVTGGDRVALVGDERIDTAELSTAATSAVQQLRQENPTLTIQAFVESGGLDDLLDSMISRTALAELGRMSGLRAGSRLVDSEIVNAPQFRGLDGRFDQDTFRAALRQQGISEDVLRQDLARGLYARQQVVPLTIGQVMPRGIAQRYAGLLREKRSGVFAPIPAAAYAPEGKPTTAQLQRFYQDNRSDYIRPERRTIRYASFDAGAFADLPAPTDAQIRARYQAQSDTYAARETRSFTQLVVPTQAAAQAVLAEVRGGKSLEAAAREKGLAPSQVAATTQADFASQTSAAVARAGFAANEGALAAPARGSLGWYVLRVDDIDRRAARSLAAARDEIAAALATEQRREAVNDAAERIEDEFDRGRSLSEVAAELGLTITTSRPLTAAGQVYGTPDSAPEELARVLAIAFEMDTAEPQLAQIVPGETFLIYDVAQITRSATAPLAEIRDEVTAAWRVQTGLERAGEAATRIMRRVAQGMPMARAVAAEDVSLPAPSPVDLTREEVAQMGQLPAPMALFFSMAEGTVKRLESPSTLAWIVVSLEEIEAPAIAADDPLVAATMSQLQQAMGEEYIEQYVAAARREIDIEINDVAVSAVADQLTGNTR